MNEFKIEKGVPIPTKRSKGSLLWESFLKMEIGDSVLLGKKEAESLRSTVLRKVKADPSLKYSVLVRSESKTELQSRVWRTA